MAENKSKTVEEKAPAAEETSEDKYKLKHMGFGRYEVNGQKFKNKADAENYVAKQKAEQEFHNEFGDVLPEGYEMTVTEKVYEYRGSLMEVPMNEMYTPKDGEYSPYYDREWVWGWASHNGTSISSWKSTGWKLVTLEELQKLVNTNRAPGHILNLVREEGSYLVYGDSVLMRKPRALWRQQKQEKAERSLRRIKSKHKQDQAFFENAGVSIDRLPVKNELTIRI